MSHISYKTARMLHLAACLVMLGLYVILFWRLGLFGFPAGLAVWLVSGVAGAFLMVRKPACHYSLGVQTWGWRRHVGNTGWGLITLLWWLHDSLRDLARDHAYGLR